MTQQSSSEKSSIVESASKSLVGVLRHGDGSSISVDSRGWVNVKDARLYLEKEFPDEDGAELLSSILETDEKNRFNLEGGDNVGFVRATRDHTRDEVDLLDVDPNDDELTWYLFDNGSVKMWVEATSKGSGVALLEKRSLPLSVPSIKIGEPDSSDFTETDREEVGEGTLKQGLHDRNYPTVAVHQSARKSLTQDVRSNMGGYKGLYVSSHPKRAKSRLPRDNSEGENRKILSRRR